MRDVRTVSERERATRKDQTDKVIKESEETEKYYKYLCGDWEEDQRL